MRRLPAIFEATLDQRRSERQIPFSEASRRFILEVLRNSLSELFAGWQSMVPFTSTTSEDTAGLRSRDSSSTSRSEPAETLDFSNDAFLTSDDLALGVSSFTDMLVDPRFHFSTNHWETQSSLTPAATDSAWLGSTANGRPRVNVSSGTSQTGINDGIDSLAADQYICIEQRPGRVDAPVVQSHYCWPAFYHETESIRGNTIE
ncbi:MAG: hypothetical protein M1819_001671 [Sarea resinae]|nr:MAG: hypothetical protein M1819_001671 [Sarea resinae]